MSPSEAREKDLQENALQRRTVVDHFMRTWRAELLPPLKDQHTSYLAIHEALRLRLEQGIPSESGPIGKEWADTVQALERIEKCLASAEERMANIVLHPTRPKALQPARAGAGKYAKGTDPVIEAEPVHPDVPRGTKENP